MKSSSPGEGVSDQVAVAFTKYGGQLVSIARATTRLKAEPAWVVTGTSKESAPHTSHREQERPVRNDRAADRSGAMRREPCPPSARNGGNSGKRVGNRARQGCSSLKCEIANVGQTYLWPWTHDAERHARLCGLARWEPRHSLTRGRGVKVERTGARCYITRVDNRVGSIGSRLKHSRDLRYDGRCSGSNASVALKPFSAGTILTVWVNAGSRKVIGENRWRLGSGQPVARA